MCNRLHAEGDYYSEKKSVYTGNAVASVLPQQLFFQGFHNP